MTVPLGFIGTLADGGVGGLDDLIEIERPGAEPASYRLPLGAARPLRRVLRTFADSGAPIGIGDKSTLILVDATDGPVVLELDPIAALGHFAVQVAKIDASANDVTIVAAAGDTINGTVAYVVTERYRGVELHAAAGTTAWFAVDLNPIAAPLQSPTFTGVPTAPTAPLGTDSPQIATTEFVNAAVAAGPEGGGWRLIEDVALTDVAAYVRDGIPASLNFLRVIFSLRPAAPAQLSLVARKAGGIDVAAHDSAQIMLLATVQPGTVNAATTVPIGTGAMPTVPQGVVAGRIELMHIQSADYKSGIMSVVCRGNTGSQWFSVGGYQVADVAPVTGIKLLFSTGNIAAGRVRVEGC